MEYLVTPVRRAAEDPQDWTAVTGPEGSPEIPGSGSGRLDSPDLLGRRGRGVRRESLSTSRTTASRVYQVSQEPTVHLVSEVLMVQLVSLVQEDLMDTPAPLVLLVPRGRWAAAVTDTKEREETRATWVFPDPVVLPATGR